MNHSPARWRERGRRMAGWSVGGLLLLAGCTDRAADLQVRLSGAQEELERTRGELEALRKENAKSSTPESAPSLPSVSQIEDNFDRGLKEMRHDLEGQLSGGKINNVISYQPQIEEKPYRAEFALEATMGARPVRLEHIPVQAGVDGKWTFPGTEELVSRLKQAPETPVVSRAEARPQPSNAAPSRPAPSSPDVSSAGPANETVTVRWGDTGSPRPGNAPRRESPPASPPAPAPAAAEPSEPAKVMPTSRDVRVRF